MELKAPKAIFFDWDGTLVDSYQFLVDAHGAVRGRFGLPLFEEGEYEQYFGKPRDVLYRLIYGEGNYEQAKIWFQDYVLAHHIDALKPIKGAGELLAVVQDMNIPMGVVSNKKSDFIRKEAEKFGWESYFESITGAGDAAQDKPAVDPLVLGLCNAGLSLGGEDIWFVGDTDSDLKCAQDFGCVSVLLRNGVDTAILEHTYKPHLALECCARLQEKLLHCV